MIRLAVVAPLGTRCGIADYARLLAQTLPADFDIQWIDPLADTSSDRRRDAARCANKADLVHLHYETNLFAPVKPYRNRFTAFLKQLRAPVVVTLHDQPPELVPRWRAEHPYHLRDLLRDIAYLPFFRHWDAEQYAHTSHWIVHTEELAQRVARHVAPERITLVPMPTPPSSLHWTLEAAAPHCLITPGFIKAPKGYEDLLPVLAARPSWQWVIAGGPQDEADQEYLAELKRQIGRLKVQDRVTITGYLSRDAMEQVLAKATLAVFPFRRTAGSSSVAWAAAVGTPIVATALPALCSMKQAGAGIETLPADDNTTWADILDHLLDAPDRLLSLSEKNIQYAGVRSYAHLGSQMADLFRTLISS